MIFLFVGIGHLNRILRGILRAGGFGLLLLRIVNGLLATP
jgi:hypothetical protein